MLKVCWDIIFKIYLMNIVFMNLNVKYIFFNGNVINFVKKIVSSKFSSIKKCYKVYVINK